MQKIFILRHQPRTRQDQWMEGKKFIEAAVTIHRLMKLGLSLGLRQNLKTMQLISGSAVF
ncbi:MAG: hypothetical protein CVU42_07670 [Chloroflexi bacterium HGW-Chloroflexi-4]|nr:MAG: hypothetical protein CVU42_07670 [Chloroflexi bacterium HGW-Chloroflexi-4]